MIIWNPENKWILKDKRAEKLHVCEMLQNLPPNSPIPKGIQSRTALRTLQWRSQRNNDPYILCRKDSRMSKAQLSLQRAGHLKGPQSQLLHSRKILICDRGEYDQFPIQKHRQVSFLVMEILATQQSHASPEIVTSISQVGGSTTYLGLFSSAEFHG